MTRTFDERAGDFGFTRAPAESLTDFHRRVLHALTAEPRGTVAQLTRATLPLSRWIRHVGFADDPVAYSLTVRVRSFLGLRVPLRARPRIRRLVWDVVEAEVPAYLALDVDV